MAKRKPQIYVEDVKQRHVSHWDEDWLTYDQLDRLHQEANEKRRRNMRRQFTYIGIILFALAFSPTIFHHITQLFGGF